MFIRIRGLGLGKAKGFHKRSRKGFEVISKAGKKRIGRKWGWDNPTRKP